MAGRVRRTWTDKELSTLKNMSELNFTIDDMHEYLPTRTKPVIRAKLRTLGLSYDARNHVWTEEEIEELESHWYDSGFSISYFMKRFGVSRGAVFQQAYTLGLGLRKDCSYLSFPDLVDEMQVSKHQLYYWKRCGLITKKSKARHELMVNSDDLLEFLKLHPNLYDASKISPNLFISEPDWLKEKRISDYRSYKKHRRYSDLEINYIILLFFNGKSNAEIAKTVNRSESAIENLLLRHGCYRQRLNQHELQILRNCDGQSISVFLEKLPLRSESKIRKKCKELGIKIID